MGAVVILIVVGPKRGRREKGKRSTQSSRAGSLEGMKTFSIEGICVCREEELGEEDETATKIEFDGSLF